MKDQRSLDEVPTSFEKWDRAKAIMLESLLKPDNQLRSCAHNQMCFDDLMNLNNQVVEYVQSLSNPRAFVDVRDYDAIPSRY